MRESPVRSSCAGAPGRRCCRRDVLLHLLGHRAEPEQTTTEAIAAANGLSPTVALRWLSLLQADGQVQFRPERTPAGWELSVPFLARMIGYLRDHYPELL